MEFFIFIAVLLSFLAFVRSAGRKELQAKLERNHRNGEAEYERLYNEVALLRGRVASLEENIPGEEAASKELGAPPDKAPRESESTSKDAEEAPANALGIEVEERPFAEVSVAESNDITGNALANDPNEIDSPDLAEEEQSLQELSDSTKDDAAASGSGVLDKHHPVGTMSSRPGTNLPPVALRTSSTRSNTESAKSDSNAPARTFSLEELLGTQLLLKAGVLIVVIGVVYFLAYALGEMGPLGRVITGYAVAASMLAAGFVGENRPKYKTFGRALLAGGFGIAYFVSFAMHFIPAARVISSLGAGIALMLVVGASAVVFSFRYRHEWTTASAFLLALVTLFIAAVEPNALYNVVATTIVGAGIALVSWRMNWHRMLAIGASATWFTVLVWLPRLQTSALADGGFTASLVQLCTLWLAFQLALAFPRSNDAPNLDTWFGGALLANLIGVVGLGIYLVNEVYPGSLYLLPAVFSIIYIAQAWLFARQGRKQLYLVAGALAFGFASSVIPFKTGPTNRWIPVLQLLLTQMMLTVGIWVGERFFRTLAYLAFAGTTMALLSADTTLIREISFRNLAWGAAAGLFLTNVLLFAHKWRDKLNGAEIPAVPFAASGLFTLFLVCLFFSALPSFLTAAVLGSTALCFATVATRYGRRDFLWEAAALAGITVVALLGRGNTFPPGGALGAGGGSFVSVVCLYGAYSLLGRHWDKLNEHLGDFAEYIVVSVAGVAWLSLSIFAYAHVSSIWLASFFALSAVLHNYAAVRTTRPELLLLAIGHTVLASFGLLRCLSAHDLFASVVSLVTLYANTEFFYRTVKRDSLSLRWLPLDRSKIAASCYLHLLLPTAFCISIIGQEAYYYSHPYFVGPILAAVGMLYFAVASRTRSSVWKAHGHLILAASAVSLFMYNFWYADLGYLPRAATALPVVACLAYSYLKHLQPERDGLFWQVAPLIHFYSAVTIVATLLLTVLVSSWVVLGWALLGLALLWRWRRNASVHFCLASVCLSVATVLRGLTTNLFTYNPDFGAAGWALPLSCIVLLASYWLVRRHELKNGKDSQLFPKGWEWAQWGRLGWLFSAITLATAFSSIASEGTLLTVFLSIEALFWVALGLWLKEPSARYTGLGLFGVCMLKLFLHDMGDLSGLPRIGSFVVLGVALIAVSYGYTRYRERLKSAAADQVTSSEE